MDKSKEQKRQERINNCGKGLVVFTDDNGVEQYKRKLCGYMDCPTCYGIELNKRADAIKKSIGNHDGLLFKSVVSNEDWARIQRQLSKEQSSYIKSPIDETNFLYSTYPVEGSQPILVIDAVNELCKEEMLFSSRKRSSSKDWPLVVKKEADNSASTCINVFYPFFEMSSSLETIKWANKLKLFASTWINGQKVTLDNLQEYMNYKKNRYIEMMIAAGYTFVLEKSTMSRNQVFTEKEISKWAINNATIKNDIQGEGAEEIFNHSDQRLYRLVMGLEEHKDYISMFIDYLNFGGIEERAREFEKMGEELFRMFYGDEEADRIKAHIEGKGQ